MKQPGRIILALFIPWAAMAALAWAVQAQTPSLPPTRDETLTHSDGQITVTVTSGIVEFAPPVILQSAARATEFGRLAVHNPNTA
jgi:hypothetical protein